MYFWLFALIPVMLAENGGLNINFHQNNYEQKFERLEMVRTNKEVLNFFLINTYKYNRTSAVANLTWSSKDDIGRSLQLIIQTYKFMSNEYRLFPLRLEVNFCAAIDADTIGVSNFKTCGNFTECFIRKNKIYHVCKWKPDQSKFPPLIPSGKYMLEVQGILNAKESFLMRGYGEIVYPVSN